MRVHSLRTRLVVQTVLIVAAAVVLVGWFIYQALIQQELALQQARLSAAAQQMSGVVERARSDTLFAAKLPPIQGIIRSRPTGIDPKDGSAYDTWRDRLTDIFSDLMLARPEYFQVRFIGLADGGREIVRVDRVDGRPTPAAELQRKGQRDYFARLAREPEGFVYLSRFDLNVEHGRLEIPYRPTLRLGTPVYAADGQPFGMIVINLDAGQMLRRMAADRPAHRAFYLANAAGDFLVHPNPQRTFGFAVGAAFRIQKEMPETAGFMADARQDSALIEAGGLGGGRITHLLRERYDPQNPSRYVVLAEVSDFGGLFSTAASVRAQALWVTGLVALAAGVLAWWSAARIVKPLARLTAAAGALGAGKRDVTLDLGRRDELGQLARGFSDMAQQVSEREAEIARERERLRLYLRHSPSALAVLDRELRYQVVSDRWLQDFGLEGTEIIGKGLFDCTSMLPSRWVAVLRQGLESQAEDAGEDGFERPDGRFEWLRWATHPWYQADGELGGLVVFTEVITARKEAEKALRELSYQLASAERIARVGNWIWETASDRFTLSEESRRIHGIVDWRGDFDRSALLEAVHPDDRERVAAALDGLVGQGLPLDIRYQLADGRTHIRTMAQPERFGGTATGRVLGTWQDVTAQVVVEAQLRDAARRLGQSNRELEEFAYVASHDLQEPLRKIQAFGDRLHGKYAEGLGEQGGDYLRRMQESAARMSRLINDLLDYSRVTIKAQPFVPVDLNEVMQLVRQDLELTIEEQGAQLDIELLPTVSADATQMRQLLQNLVGNALKYHRPGVPPRVQVAACAVPAVPGGLDEELDYMCIEVSDNGIGFDPAYVDRIFQPFQRLHGRAEYHGTGIGLATCRKIVERHGGLIIAESAPGQGSSFRVVLPKRRVDLEQHEGDQVDVA